MKLVDMKKKVLALIEEFNPDSEFLTEDPDIAEKIREVINQIQFEMARIKKIARYVEMDVKAGDLLSFEDIGDACDHEVYQVSIIGGVVCVPKANGTMFKVMQDGTAEIDCFVYPERITEKTKDSYTFELSPDALEVMPYGIAGDLLKSDVSAEYGAVYANRYESMLQRLDPGNQLTSVYIDGGVDI